ncbi:hypothetical protein cyc_01919 [Cyclospora cayetanensis]|uniref:GYF domain-containing protein n=1 Tax=Cyclospora cayetanensis TaxID=88456 RepID=A0A1D3CSU1_9EIME|nr:hypothetical protein cyc_01919 [Cyclospora cayetanensis]
MEELLKIEGCLEPEPPLLASREEDTPKMKRCQLSMDTLHRDTPDESPALACPGGAYGPVESLTVERAKQVPLHRWEYVDDFGKTQGPYDALRIVKWIQSGFFDKRGGTLFRMAGEETSKTLLEQLPSIMTEAYAAMVLRMEKPQRMQAPPEETLEVVEMMPMNLSDQNSDIQSVLNVKALHRSLGTCDLMVVLMPFTKREDTPANRNGDCSEAALRRAHVPQKMFKIPVHSAILRLSSPIWLTEITALEEKHKQRLLYSDHPDRQEMLKYIIECQNPEALRCIINYIYGYKASITHGNPMLLVSVYLEASRFKIDKICKEVLEPLSAPMNMEALTHLASSSEAAGCEQILKECARVLCDCAFALFSGMKHMQLGPQAMALILEHDNLQLDEMQVYLSAAAWLHQYIENFGELSDPSIIIEDAQSIYKAIRFCSMSPQRLQDVREPELDSIILNACLRKFSGNEWKPRVFPWTENCEYEVQWRGSLYPTAITRANNQRAGRQWAWTIGSPRLVSEVLYATEIVRTEKGAIHVGVATDDHGNKGKLACYFDHEAKAFVTASIGTDPLWVKTVENSIWV